MQNTIWSINGEQVTVNFNGSQRRFEEILFVMIRQSPELCAMVTGVVWDFWQNGCRVDCGKLGDMIERKPNG